VLNYALLKRVQILEVLFSRHSHPQ